MGSRWSSERSFGGGLLDEIVAEKDKSCRVIFRGGIEVTI